MAARHIRLVWGIDESEARALRRGAIAFHRWCGAVSLMKHLLINGTMVTINASRIVDQENGDARGVTSWTQCFPGFDFMNAPERVRAGEWSARNDG